MEELNNKWLKLKENFKQTAQKKKIEQQYIQTALKAVFTNTDINQYLTDADYKDGKLTLVARNKSFANLLFLRQLEIKQRLENKLSITKIIIH